MKQEKERFIVLAVVLLALVSLSFFIPQNITGKQIERPFDVSVKERMMMDIVGIDFKNEISIYDNQNIRTEGLNSGSNEYDARLSIFVYNVSGPSNNTLTLVSSYVDSSLHMLPGERHVYSVIFVPPDIGRYYIKVNGNYGSRVTELWGAFWVSLTGHEHEIPPNITNQTNQTNPPVTPSPSQGGGGGGPIIIYRNVDFIYLPDMSIEYQSIINIIKGSTGLVGIKVKNTGNVPLNEMSMHVSLPNSFEADINPKTYRILNVNESTIFLIQIDPKDSAAGEYSIDFEIATEYIKRDGTITAIVGEPDNLKDQVLEKILNYEYLLGEISSEAMANRQKGFDTTIVESYIASAELSLNRSKELYTAGDYKQAMAELTLVENSLRNAVFSLGNLSIVYFYAEPFPWWIIIIILLMALFLLAVYRRKKKNEKKRPKLLEKSSEE